MPLFRPREQQLEILLRDLRPVSLLLGLVYNHTQYPHLFENEVSCEFVLAGIERGSSDSVKSEFKDYSARCNEWLCENNLVAAALARIESVGLRYKFYVSDQWGAYFSALGVWADEKAIARLEGLAADDTGIFKPAERAEAAEKFRIFMARNHSKDYLANREILPDVGGSPYCDPCSYRNT
ncbi:MAG: hypothetical protein AAF687_09565 [Pseudomonadota bacterium]